MTSIAAIAAPIGGGKTTFTRAVAEVLADAQTLHFDQYEKLTREPVNFLRELIGLYGGQLQGAVPQYLEAAMGAFKKNQQAFAGAFNNSMLADLTKRNMAMFEDAASAFTGKKPTQAAAAADPGQDEIAKLRAELAALQAKVDKISK